jgi:hypothetical protein
VSGGEVPVWDIWVVGITAAFFAIAFALVRWFDRI